LLFSCRYVQQTYNSTVVPANDSNFDSEKQPKINCSKMQPKTSPKPMVQRQMPLFSAPQYSPLIAIFQHLAPFNADKPHLTPQPANEPKPKPKSNLKHNEPKQPKSYGVSTGHSLFLAFSYRSLRILADKDATCKRFRL
jgi:hypothetical protein